MALCTRTITYHQNADAGSSGTIFRLTPSGDFSVLRSLAPYDAGLGYYPDGYYPTGGLTRGPDGTLFYGTASGGGAHGGGVISSITSGEAAIAILAAFWTTLVLCEKAAELSGGACREMAMAGPRGRDNLT